MDKPIDPAADASTPDDDLPPRPPAEIDFDACCGQGCDPCIPDLFADAQKRYRDELAASQARRAAPRCHPHSTHRASVHGRQQLHEAASGG